MKIKCPKCSSKLEVESVGDLVSCPYCLLEFTVEEPKPRRSFRSIISKFNWLRFAVVGLAVVIAISFVALFAIAAWLQSKNPEGLEVVKGIVGGVGTLLVGLVLFAFAALLIVNIILWIFLPLMVLNIKNQIAEAVNELKKITNQ